MSSRPRPLDRRLSDIPPRRGRARFRQPEGSRAFRVQTPVIVPIPRCAYRELERLPSLEVHARSRTTRWLTSLTAAHAAHRVRALRPRPCSPSLDVSSSQGHGRLDHLTSRWLGRAARAARGSELSSGHWDRRTVVTPVVIDQCQQPTISFSRRAPVRPGTLRSVFPHLAVASRFTALSASLGVRGRVTRDCSSHRSVSARTEDASSPAGFPAERDSRVHRRSRGARMPASTRGSPRWSRPVSPCRVNDVGSCRWSEASSASAACRSPTSGARSALAASDRFDVESTGRLESPSDGRSSAVISCHPARGAFTASAPTLTGRCPPPSREAPPAGDRCGPRFAALEVPASSVAEAPPSPRSPASPLPDTLVTAPRSARVGLPPSSGVVETFRTPEGPSGRVPSPIDTSPTGAGAAPCTANGARNAFGTGSVGDP